MIEKPVIAITGGTRGLGFALAQTLLNEGFAVSICARRSKEVEAAQQVLSNDGPVLTMQADVTDSASMANWLRQTANQFGRIDGLIHNASSIGDTPMPKLSDTTAENMRRVLEVNTVAPVLITQQVLPFLSRQPLALIVTVSSDAAIGGYEGWGVYGASKAALDLLCKTLAFELIDTNIQIVSVDPGDMDTEMHRLAAPSDTGLPDPSVSAKAMLPLFLPLITGSSWSCRRGARLSVQQRENGSVLVVQKGEDA